MPHMDSYVLEYAILKFLLDKESQILRLNNAPKFGDFNKMYFSSVQADFVSFMESLLNISASEEFEHGQDNDSDEFVLIGDSF